MRWYPLLLGSLVTVGSVLLAQVAVTSAGFDRAWTVLHADADPITVAPLWYGGILDPITIEGRRVAAPTVTVTGLDPQQGSQCLTAQPKYRPISSENVRTSIGLEM